MKVKRFEAPTIQEAIKQVKETLGPEAVILSVKEIKKGKGVLGLFTKGVEVTAAIDTPLPSDTPVLENKEKESIPSSTINYSQSKSEPNDSLEINAPTSKDLFYEMNELSKELKRFREVIEKFLPNKEINQSAESSILDFCGRLKKNGLSQEIALKLVEAFKEGLLEGTISEEMTVKDFLMHLLKNLITVSPPLEESSDGIKIVPFVGAPGCGKTTTLAKIADRLLKNKKKVMAITIDPRLPGREQLRFFARTLDFPVIIAASPKELAKSVQDNLDKDVILIDTAGCSPYNEFYLRDLHRYFRSIPKPLTPYLVMDITTKDEVLLKIAGSFELLNWQSLLFTKIDETDMYGTIFNQMVYTSKPLSYLGIGPRVPEDLEIATPEKVINLIMKTKGEQDGIKRCHQTAS